MHLWQVSCGNHAHFVIADSLDRAASLAAEQCAGSARPTSAMLLCHRDQLIVEHGAEIATVTKH